MQEQYFIQERCNQPTFVLYDACEHVTGLFAILDFGLIDKLVTLDEIHKPDIVIDMNYKFDDC